MITLRLAGPLPTIALLMLLGCSSVRASVSVEFSGGGSPLLGQAVPGSTVTLRVTAIGDCANRNVSTAFGETDLTKATYQWYHGDTVIKGATASSLVLSNLSASDGGNYTVHVATTDTPNAWGTIALNVAAAPAGTFVDTTYSAPDTSTGHWDYLDYVHGGSIDAVLADGSVVSSSMAIGDVKGWKIFGPDGAYRTGWTEDVVHYGHSLHFWPDGTIIDQLLGGPSPTNVGVSVRMLDGSTVLPLPTGFTYTDVSAELVDGTKLLIAQDHRLVRLDASRALDSTFTATLPAATTGVADLKSDYGGHYLVTVVDASGTGTLLRFNHDGSADASFTPFNIIKFASSSRTVVDPSWIGPFPQHDGGILWAVATYAPTQIQIVRLLPDGTRDSAFSGQIPSGGGVQIDGDGRCYTRCQGALWRFMAGGHFQLDPDFYPGAPDGATTDFRLAPDGKVLVAGAFSHWAGHATVDVARLLTTNSSPTTQPAVWLETLVNDDADWEFVHFGQKVEIRSIVVGTGPFTYDWVALNGGPAPTAPHSPTLTFDNFSAANFGRYQLRITNATGTALSDVVDLSATSLPQPGLVNLSGRATVGSGENTLIAGFVMNTSLGGGRDLLLRGAGPVLANFGVSPTATDPVLTVFDATGAVLAQNDNWSDQTYPTAWMSSYFAGVGAFAFPTGSADSALAAYWTGGAHTLHLTDRNPHDRVGLVEIYDQMGADFYPGRLVNLSLRAHVGTGANIAIGGFVIVDPAGFGRSVKVLVRGVGPTLAGFGIQHPLADPTLTLFDAAGGVLASNDNWGQNPDPAALATAMKQVGAFDLPADSKDAALLLDLPAGLYTSHITGADGGTGVALLEIYRVP